MRFPLAELTKPEVRALAAEAELPVARRAESQDPCFLAGTGKARFLPATAGLEDAPGEIVAPPGDVVGTHRGFHHFTVGQRKGLGVAAAEPLYVLAHRGASNRVVVGSRDELAVDRVAVRGRACIVPAPRSTPSGCVTTRAQSPAASPETPVRGPSRT